MRLGILFIFFTTSLLFIGCQNSNDSWPSTLIITIEGLSGSSFSCSSYDEEEKSGFQVLCKEAVRFTHGFTPSPMAQAGLGAILTGLAPINNGLRDNGLTFLNAKLVTIPEKLIEKKLHTFFIVSAPTIKRYSRLHQGFELFDDDLEMTPKQLYRPISESLKVFKKWITTTVLMDSFFAVIHSSDLLFTNSVTQTELLEVRPKGYEGQLEEIDENLFSLFNYLKETKRWHQLFVMVVGLNGTPNYNRFNEVPGTNLFAENTSVPIFIKPPKGREEIPRQWKVDARVSLQDLGATLSDIYKLSDDKTNQKPFNGLSLIPVINGTRNNLFDQRNLLIESAWAKWSLNKFPRYSLRDDQWLTILDKTPLLYNTLTDRNELNRISPKDSTYISAIEKFKESIKELSYSPYEKPKSQLGAEFHLAQIILENEGRTIDTLVPEIIPIIQDNPFSSNIKWLVVFHLLNKKRFDLIEDFNTVWKDRLLEQFLKLRNNESLDSSADPCFYILSKRLKNSDSGDLGSCQNNDFLILIDWILNATENSEILFDKSTIIYKHHLLSLNLAQLDLTKGGSILGAKDKNLQDLALMRLLLNLPRFQKEILLLEKTIR